MSNDERVAVGKDLHLRFLFWYGRCFHFDWFLGGSLWGWFGYGLFGYRLCGYGFFKTDVLASKKPVVGGFGMATHAGSDFSRGQHFTTVRVDDAINPTLVGFGGVLGQLGHDKKVLPLSDLKRLITDGCSWIYPIS